jgi:hypothetical protein
MARYRAKPAETQDGQQVAIEIVSEGKEQAPELLRVSAPDGFPPERLHQLADYWVQGFNAACARLDPDVVDLSDFAPETRGRPIEPEVEEEGREAAKLREQNPHLRWRQIARKVCRVKATTMGHRCDRKCDDRVRQAVNVYRQRQEVKDLEHFD